MSCVRMCETFPGAGPRPSRKLIKKLSFKEKRGGIKEPIGLPEAMPSRKVPEGIWKRGCVSHLSTGRLDGKIILVRPRFIFLMIRHPIVILRSFKSSLSAFSTGEHSLRGRYGNRPRPQPLVFGCAGADGSEPQETEVPPFSLCTPKTGATRLEAGVICERNPHHVRPGWASAEPWRWRGTVYLNNDRNGVLIAGGRVPRAKVMFFLLGHLRTGLRPRSDLEFRRGDSFIP